jgi:hypothetical protein
MKTVEAFAARKGSPVPPGVNRCLSIDPGKKCTGWALWDTILVACGTGEPPLEGVNRVTIEIPQTYPNSPVPYQDLVTLAFLAGRYIGKVQGRAWHNGVGNIKARWMFPHEWKGNLPKDVCESRVRKKLLPEERLVVEECERFVAKGLMNNVWDAVGIGFAAYRGAI